MTCNHQTTYWTTMPVMIGRDEHGNAIISHETLQFCRLCGRRVGGFQPIKFESLETALYVADTLNQSEVTK